MDFWNEFKQRLKFARGVQKALQPKPNLLNLATAIVENAQKSVVLLDEYLSRSFSKGSQEYLNKRANLFFEVASFLAHLASRIVFKSFGPQQRQSLNNYLGPMLVEFTISHFYKTVPSQDPHKEPSEEFKQTFYDYLQASEFQYGSCKSWVLKAEEDVAFADKFAAGLKSGGMINLLTDNVVKILNDDNPVTHSFVGIILVSSISAKEFEEIVLRTREELQK